MSGDWLTIQTLVEQLFREQAGFLRRQKWSGVCRVQARRWGTPGVFQVVHSYGWGLLEIFYQFSDELDFLAAFDPEDEELWCWDTIFPEDHEVFVNSVQQEVGCHFLGQALSC